jgi:bla regulator protein blaR1
VSGVEGLPWLRDVAAWSLVHALWQGAALALLHAGVRALVRSPAARHGAGMGLVLAAAGAPLATGAWLAWRAGALAAAPAGMVASGPGVGWLPGGVAAAGSALLAWLPLAWAAGVVLLGLRAAGGWRLAGRLAAGAAPAPAGWQPRLERLRDRLGIRAPVRLALSARVAVPVLVGWRRPSILLPAAALASHPPEELELLIAHELAHLRRRDPAANLAQTAAGILLFFHPAACWMGARIRADREAACDDMVVALCRHRALYARALARAEMLRGGSAAAALAATGDRVVDRLRRLAAEPAPRPAPRRLAAAAAPLAAAALLAAAGYGALPPSAGALAASRPLPRMEVHASDPAGAFRLSVARGRVVAAAIGDVPLPPERILQARDSVRFLGPAGEPVLAVHLTRDGIRWHPRPAPGPGYHPPRP